MKQYPAVQNRHHSKSIRQKALLAVPPGMRRHALNREWLHGARSGANPWTVLVCRQQQQSVQVCTSQTCLSSSHELTACFYCRKQCANRLLFSFSVLHSSNSPCTSGLLPFPPNRQDLLVQRDARTALIPYMSRSMLL